MQDMTEAIKNYFSQYISIDSGLGILWAATSVVMAVLLGLLLRQRLKAYFRKKNPRKDIANDPVKSKDPKNHTLGQRISIRLTPMAAPLFNILLLMLGVVVLRKMGYQGAFLEDIRPLALGWLLIAMVYAVTASRVKTVFAALLIVPLSLPFMDPYMAEGGQFLESISLSVGKTTVNAFQIFKLLITGFILFWIADAVVQGVEISLLRMRQLRSSTRQLLQNLTSIGVYIIAILVALSAIGIDLTAFAVLGGALGVGIGLGLQKIASNFISGLILLMERTIQVNDMIEIEGSNIQGMVRHTGARYTLIETLDNRNILIPNEHFIINRVINWTYANPRGMVKLNIGVAHANDLDKVRDTLMEAAASHPRVLRDPAPNVTIREVLAATVEFTLTAWIADVRDARGVVASDIYFEIWRRFKENGIAIVPPPGPAITPATIATAVATALGVEATPQAVEAAENAVAPAADKTGD